MITITVVFFHLWTPNGKVLVDFSIFYITQDALLEGLFRGLTLNGFVFLSLWCTSPQLSLPTKYGRTLSLSILYFNQLLQITSNHKLRSFMKKKNTSIMSPLQEKKNI